MALPGYKYLEVVFSFITLLFFFYVLIAVAKMIWILAASWSPSSCISSQSLCFECRIDLSETFFSQIPSVTGSFELVRRIFALIANENNRNRLTFPPKGSQEFTHQVLQEKILIFVMHFSSLYYNVSLFSCFSWLPKAGRSELDSRKAAVKLFVGQHDASHVTSVVDPWCCGAPRVSAPRR